MKGAKSPDFGHGHRTEYSAHVLMSTPAPLDPAHFSHLRDGHPVQNGEIFFVSKSVGARSILKVPQQWFQVIVMTRFGVYQSQTM